VAKVPTIKVPVTVDASGVEGQLRKAEKAFKDSERRLARVRSAATPALGALGGGALGGVAGGLGQLGIGGAAVGAGAMAAAAPVLIAQRMISAFAEATKGSTEALQKFRETGINTTQMNSTMLEILSSMEARAQKLAEAPSAFQSFLAGAGSETNGILQALEGMSEGLNGFAAFIGALTSGKSFREAFLAMQLPSAGESRGEQIRAEMEQIAAQRQRFTDVGGSFLGGVATDLAPYMGQMLMQITRALT
jgi:hypothetical protein